MPLLPLIAFIFAGLCFAFVASNVPEPWWRRALGLGLVGLTVAIASKLS